MNAFPSPPKLMPALPDANAAQQPNANRGAHDPIFKVVSRHIASEAHVLDLGAGQGAFSQLLLDAGRKVDACDLYPEMFRCPGVECRKADAEQPLPYADGTFDCVVALELVEHLESQLGMFRDVTRVLKPGGIFLFSTPNIASLKSRLRFLFTGYVCSHPPLDPDVHDPVCQRIAPFTPDRYQFIMARAGLELTQIETDKYQKSSLAFAWLSPLIQGYTRIRYGTSSGVRMQNCAATHFGRTMIGVARKRENDTPRLLRL